MNSRPSGFEFFSANLVTHSKLILCVDDEPNILYTREKILEAEGYAVLSALDGADALELFDEHPRIGLVLLDYAMPGMDGTAVAKEMKTRRPSVPILMISAYANSMSKMTLPFIDCLITKDGSPEHLLEKVHQMFAMNSASRRSA